jgi:membrane protease YdiL (CAAX protease family)
MSAVTATKSRTVIAFLVVAVGLGWVLSLLGTRLPPNLAPVVAIPVALVPAVLAVIVLRISGTAEERRALRRRLTTLRIGWRWYAFVLVLPAAHLAAIGLASFAGGSVSLHPALLAALPLLLVTSLGEEVGWRGYALPKLQERLSPLGASVVLGLAWAMFHWVALLANQNAPLAYVAISTVQLTAMSAILAFVFNNTRQALPVLVLGHALYNTVSIGVAPLAETGMPLVAFGLSAGLTAMVAASLVAAAGPSLLIKRRAATADAPAAVATS